MSEIILDWLLQRITYFGDFESRIRPQAIDFRSLFNRHPVQVPTMYLTVKKVHTNMDNWSSYIGMNLYLHS